MKRRTPGMISAACCAMFALALLAPLLLPPPAAAVEPRGAWLPAATSMSPVPRYGHTGVTLKDGKVLLIGGYDMSGRPLNTAELYDPDRRTLTAVGPMMVARGNPAAALLPDGRVYVVGGMSNDNFSQEMYEPGTRTFLPGPPLAVPRGEGTTATTMGDGNILVAGGDPTGMQMEVFYTSGFHMGPPVVSPFPLRFPSATALSDGRVLVAGGDNTVSAFLFATGSLPVPTGNMTQPRGPFPAFSATRLKDGRVLFAGGRPFPTAPDLRTLEIFDPATRNFTPIGYGMCSPRAYHSASLLPTGKVAFLGGAMEGTNNETFDPVHNTPFPENMMPVSVSRHVGVTLATGDPAFFGGQFIAGDLPFAGSYYYVLGEGGFRLVDGIGFPYRDQAGATLRDGRALIVDGGGAIHACDPFAGSCVPVGGLIGGPRASLAAAVLDNGTVLLAGGQVNGYASPVADLLDPLTMKTAFAGPMGTPRYGHVARLLPSGKVLVAGGYDISGARLTSAESYDPRTGRWTPVRNAMTMPRAGSDLSATLLDNGSVLIVGGGSPESDLYDPKTESFSPVPSGSWWYMSAYAWPYSASPSFGESAAAAGAEARVLHAGGWYGYATYPPPPPDGPYTGDAALYDVPNRMDLPIGPLRIPRGRHSAVTLVTGDVLVVGGIGNDGLPAFPAERHETRSMAPFIHSLSPGTAAPGATVEIRGGRLCGNELRVTFAGFPATVDSCLPAPNGDLLRVRVPGPATDGPVRVNTTTGGSAGYPFTVLHEADAGVRNHRVIGVFGPVTGYTGPVKGSIVQFGAVVANDGPTVADNVVVRIAATQKILASRIDTGSCIPLADNTVMCNLPVLPPGAVLNVGYDVEILDAGPATMTSEIFLSSPTPDPDPSDNRSVLQTPIGNIPPVVRSVSATPLSGSAPLQVNFTADAFDEGRIVSYEWSFGDGSPVLTTVVPSVFHVYDRAGAFVTTVRVTDNGGATATGNLPAPIVVEPPNLPPVVSSVTATPPGGLVPLAVRFDVAASDPEGRPLTYAWNFGDGSPVVTTSAPSVGHTYAAAGTFTATVTVTDDRNAKATGSATVATRAPLPPAIGSFTATPSRGTAPVDVQFAVAATDPDGDIVRVDWDFDGDGTIDRTGTVFTATWRYGQPGSYNARVIVTDGRGLSAQAGVPVTVLGAPILSGSVVRKGTSKGGYYVDIRLLNTGTATAEAVRIDTVVAAVTSGTGTVSFLGNPSLPYAVGSIPAGQAATVRLLFGVPKTVKAFSITEGGTMNNAEPKAFPFSITQSVTVSTK